jgi:hypothetical protein
MAEVEDASKRVAGLKKDKNLLFPSELNSRPWC